MKWGESAHPGQGAGVVLLVGDDHVLAVLPSNLSVEARKGQLVGGVRMQVQTGAGCGGHCNLQSFRLAIALVLLGAVATTVGFGGDPANSADICTSCWNPTSIPINSELQQTKSNCSQRYKSGPRCLAECMLLCDSCCLHPVRYWTQCLHET